jgi:hypothetical protein
MTAVFPAVPPADVAASPRVTAAWAALTAWLATPGGQAYAAAGADPLAVPGSDLLTYDQLTAACSAAVQDARRSRRDAEPFAAREVTAALRGLFPNVDMSSRALGGGRVRVRLPVASANELGIGRSGAGHASAWLSRQLATPVQITGGRTYQRRDWGLFAEFTVTARAESAAEPDEDAREAMPGGTPVRQPARPMATRDPGPPEAGI